MMRPCQHCGVNVTVRHEREGLIHKGPKPWPEAKEWYGYYVCQDPDNWKGTKVAS